MWGLAEQVQQRLAEHFHLTDMAMAGMDSNAPIQRKASRAGRVAVEADVILHSPQHGVSLKDSVGW